MNKILEVLYVLAFAAQNMFQALFYSRESTWDMPMTVRFRGLHTTTLSPRRKTDKRTFQLGVQGDYFRLPTWCVASPSYKQAGGDCYGQREKLWFHIDRRKNGSGMNCRRQR